MTTCKHRHTWIIAAMNEDCYEWCHDCGAFRNMSGNQRAGSCSVYPASAWCRPGDDYQEWQKRSKAYRKRMGVGHGN